MNCHKFETHTYLTGGGLAIILIFKWHLKLRAYNKCDNLNKGFILHIEQYNLAVFGCNLDNK